MSYPVLLAYIALQSLLVTFSLYAIYRSYLQNGKVLYGLLAINAATVIITCFIIFRETT